MSHPIVTSLDKSVGNIDSLLARKGRASTPLPPGGTKLKLAEVLGIIFHSSSPFHGTLKVATIVHDEMYEELENSYSVMPLLPSCLISSVDAGQPGMIVIHRAAFQDGPWFGAEDASGGTSVDVIKRLRPWSRKRKVPVLFIENGAPDGFYTSVLREIGTEILSSVDDLNRVQEGAPRKAVFEIGRRYAGQQAAQLVNGNQ